ncbi:MAG: type II CAAX endopeptidase family protein [Oscillospiraceae bacterium]
MEKNKKSILTFIAIAFGLTWVTILVAFVTGVKNSDPSWGIILMLCMFFPAIASLLTRKITGEGFHRLRIRPRFKGHIFKYVLAIFLPSLCIICGCAAYFFFFPNNLDASCANIVNGIITNEKAAGREMTADSARGAFYAQILIALVIAPFVNLIPVFGEELGWRGFLLQKLSNICGPVKAIVFSGVIWGLWHAPMIAMGHNYGIGYWGYPWLGILLMVLFCTAVGTLCSYITLHVGSIIPACLIHSTINAISGIGIYFLSTTTGVSNFEILMVGPTATGILGMSMFILVGALFLLKARRIKWNSETEMAE